MAKNLANAYVKAAGGNTSRPLKDHLAASYANVVDHGAIGDGSTEDDDAFTAAMSAKNFVFIPKPETGYSFSGSVGPGENAWFLDPSATWAELFDGGNLKICRTRGTNISLGGSSGSSIWRFADRVYVGGAAQMYAGSGTANPDGGSSWLNTTAEGPAYLPANAGILYMSGGNSNPVLNPPVGIVSAMQSSTTGQGAIGVGTAVIADTDHVGVWGFIVESQRENVLSTTIGMEFAVKNKGSNETMRPYAQTQGVHAVWLAAGGGQAFGGAATNPSTTGVAFVNSGTTFNTGIVFMYDSITSGEAISMATEAVGGAHRLQWYNAAGNQVFGFSSTATGATGWQLQHSNNNLNVIVSGNNIFNIQATSTNVNGFTFSPGDAGGPVTIDAKGADTNVTMRIRGKGPTGMVSLRGGSNTQMIDVNETGIGFFAASPLARQTITGSRGGNAALASLLTALAAHGIIVNSTSA